MRSRANLLVATLLVPFAHAARAEDAFAKNRIGSVRSSILDPETGEWLALPNRDAAAATLPTLLKTGKMMWDVIRDNKSVYDLATDNVSVLPREARSPLELTGWKQSVSPTLKIEIFDVLGGSMMNFAYHMNFNYGGRYRGAGDYLANVTMVAESLDLHAIGLKFQASVQTLEPVNVGTREHPLAQLKVLVPLRSEGFINSVVKTDEFTFTADGRVEVLQRSSEHWKSTRKLEQR